MCTDVHTSVHVCISGQEINNHFCLSIVPLNVWHVLCVYVCVYFCKTCVCRQTEKDADICMCSHTKGHSSVLQEQQCEIVKVKNEIRFQT